MRVCQFRHFGTGSEALIHRCSFCSLAKPQQDVKRAGGRLLICFEMKQKIKRRGKRLHPMRNAYGTGVACHAQRSLR